MKKILLTIGILILLGIAGWAYWYFMLGPVQPPAVTETQNPPSFQPLNTKGSGSGRNGTSTPPSGTIPNQPGRTTASVPALRMLSATPVGGYNASSTAATTTIVWVDRGRGNVYQTTGDSLQITTLSNTVVPKIFNALWNKNLTAFIASLFGDDTQNPMTVYSELSRHASGASSTISTSSAAPFELHGKNISGNVIGYAASPDGTRLFVLMNETGTGVGYIASFSGQNMTRLFSTPLTQVTIDWPSDNFISITTKSSAYHNGVLYFVNAKTGAWSKILGPLSGLDATVSHDAKYVFYSTTGSHNDISSAIYNIATATSTESVFRTLASKCAWGRQRLSTVYCGVPSEIVPAIYPDAWNLGQLSTNDKLWQIDASTGEVRLLSSLLEQADRSIDAYRLDLDPRDRYLFFMNKNDLSLWSFDLKRAGR